MRIGTQNILSIVPLFLGLALVLGGLLFVIERQERLWGQEQQASSYAIAIAEFAAERSMDTHQPNFSPSTDPRLRTALDRILSSRRVKAVVALAPTSNTPLWSYPAGAQSKYRWVYPSGLSSRMSHDGVWVSSILSSGQRQAQMEAYAPMLSRDGALLGSIGVVTDASAFLRESQQTLTGVALAALGVIAVGLLITTLVSWLISREVRVLSGSAVAMTSGQLEAQAAPGHIQEIGDLGNTFNTMCEVLKDVLSRTKRALANKDRFHTPAEYAASYREAFLPPLSAEIDGVAIAGAAMGTGAGFFWTVVRTEYGCRIALGQVTADDEIRTEIAASAASHCVESGLTQPNLAAALTETAGLLDITALQCLDFRDSAVDHWTVHSDETEPAGRRAVVQSYASDTRARWVLLQTKPDATATVERYVRQFERHAPADLIREIAAVLPPGSEGAVIVAGPSTTASTNPLSDAASTRR